MVGLLIALAGFGFVISRAVDHWSDVRHAVSHSSRMWLVLALVLATLGMTAIAVAWKFVLAALGADISARDAIRWYFPGELGKYVPGGIWPVVGRAELSWRGGVRRSVSYASVALSLGSLYLAGIAVVTVTLPFVLAAHHNSSAPLLVVLLLPVGIAVLHPKVLHALRRSVAKVTKRDIAFDVPSWRTSLLLVLGYVPAWLLIGTATWCVARAFDHNAPFGQVFVAACASWVVGFVLVPVPGGVGVREAAFVATAGLSPAIGATVALVARLMFMAVDALGAVLAPVATRPRIPSKASQEPAEKAESAATSAPEP
jgi:uncharacterized membrane protein YbhN (UPF0104 family)